MRHALIRFFNALDVDAAWYVPNPSPAVFRTTKNNHNVLQGVAPPDLRLTDEQKEAFDAWILKNGLRWTQPGGPLAPGGVDIAFIGGCFTSGCATACSPSSGRQMILRCPV